MDVLDRMNTLRGMNFIAGVLAGQMRDPICSECRKFAATAADMVEQVEALRAQAATGDAGIEALLPKVEAVLVSLSIPLDPKPQRKLKNCRFPEGKCLVKHSMKFFKMAAGIEDEGKGQPHANGQ